MAGQQKDYVPGFVLGFGIFKFIYSVMMVYEGHNFSLARADT